MGNRQDEILLLFFRKPTTSITIPAEDGSQMGLGDGTPLDTGNGDGISPDGETQRTTKYYTLGSLTSPLIPYDSTIGSQPISSSQYTFEQVTFDGRDVVRVSGSGVGGNNPIGYYFVGDRIDSTHPVIVSHIWRAVTSSGGALLRNNSYFRILDDDTNEVIVDEIRLNDVITDDTGYQTFESDDISSLLAGVSRIRVELYLKTRVSSITKTNYFDEVSLTFTELPDGE